MQLTTDNYFEGWRPGLGSSELQCGRAIILSILWSGRDGPPTQLTNLLRSMASVTKSAGKAASLVFSGEAGFAIRGNLAILGLSASGYGVLESNRTNASPPFFSSLEYFDESGTFEAYEATISRLHYGQMQISGCAGQTGEVSQCVH